MNVFEDNILYRKAGYIGFLKLTKAGFSLLLVFLSIQFFGLSKERDYWVLASSFTGMLSQFAFGPIIDIFRIKFISQKNDHGEKQALKEVESLNTVILFFGILVLIFFLLFKNYSLSLANPGGKNFDSTFYILMLISSLTIITSQKINILQGLLNSYESYFLPEILLILGTIINILFMYFFTDSIGIFSLIAGQLFTHILSIILFNIQLKKLTGQYLLYSFSIKSQFVYWIFAAPFWLSYGVGQLVNYSEKAICSFGPEGYISMFDYSRKIIEMPMSLILGIVNSYLVIKLSEQFTSKKHEEGVKIFINSAIMLILLLLPILVCLTLNGNELFYLLFKKNTNNVIIQDFVYNLIILSFFLISFLLNSLVNIILISLKENKKVALFNTFSLVINLFLNVIVYFYLNNYLFLILLNSAFCITGLTIYQCYYLFKKINKMDEFIKLAKLVIVIIAICFFTYHLKNFFYKNNAAYQIIDFSILYIQEILSVGVFVFLYLIYSKTVNIKNLFKKID